MLLLVFFRFEPGTVVLNRYTTLLYLWKPFESYSTNIKLLNDKGKEGKNILLAVPIFLVCFHLSQHFCFYNREQFFLLGHQQ